MKPMDPRSQRQSRNRHRSWGRAALSEGALGEPARYRPREIKLGDRVLWRNPKLDEPAPARAHRPRPRQTRS